MDNTILFIRDFFNSFIISVKPYFTIIVTVFSFFSAILTCIGRSLPGILISPKDWKYRKVLKYKIIKAHRDMKYDIDFIKPTISFFIEMVKIFEILLAICIFLYFVAPWIDGNESKENKITYGCILACILFSSISALICKLIHNKNIPSLLYRMVSLIIGNCIGLFIIISLFNSNSYNDITVYIMLTCMGLYNYVIIEIDFLIDKNSYIAKKLKVLRFTGGIFYIIYFYVSAKNNYSGNNFNILFFCSWIILCLIENIIFIVKMNNVPRVEFQISTENEKINTKSTIYQFQCNKVKYSLDDRNVEIINDDKINSIDYTIKNYINVKKKDVICILETEEKINFDGCKFIKDSWVSFYKIDDKGKHIKIININKIKKIMIK